MASSGVAEAPRGRAPTRSPSGPLRFLLARTLPLLVLTSLALTAAGAVYLLLSEDVKPPKSPPGTPREATVAQLRTLAEHSTTPVYWAGTAPGTRFEVTQTRRGKFFVRYLPAGVKVADKRPDYLTVGTYPYPRAYAATEESAEQKGMDSAAAPGGGLAVWSDRRPSSVYVAYPGADVLVEVFSPKAAQARQLVLKGDVGAVDRQP